jgi:hypothetical protein
MKQFKYLDEEWGGASLVPAAAVIPAPISHIKVVALKNLVLEIWV